MTWISADAWLDACGAWGDRLRAPYVARGGEDALGDALGLESRRVFALVGRPGAGASRLALELARRQRGPVWYRDPVRAPSPRDDAHALERAVLTLSGRATPVVVLDAPDPAEARAVLGELAARRIHPRLRVIVPCDPDTAPDLPDLAMLPRASIVVVAVDGEPTPTVVPDVPEAWLPLVLAGRGPWSLVDARLAARDPSSDTSVCLIDHRARAALAAAHAAALPAILDAHPALRPAITAALLTWTRGDVPAAVIPHLDPALDLVAAVRRGVAPSPALIAWLDAHVVDPARRADLARLRRDKEAVADQLATELATTEDPARRARASIALASLTREPALAEAAVTIARGAAPPGLLADALIQLAELRLATGDPAGARMAYAEVAAALDADGAVGMAAVVRSWSATIAADAADFEGAAELMTRVIADRRALGDAQGASLALGRLARWEVERGRADDARRAVEDAAGISAAIGDPRGLGYARWFLGALAERAGDGVAAMAHYAASLDAYAELGDVPERVVSSLATLQRAYDGTPAPRAPLPEPLSDGSPLVPLGRRST